MLTVEYIKKAVDEFKPDGFTFIIDASNNHFILFNSESMSIGAFLNLTNEYDLFLDRIIQGINKRHLIFEIHQYSDFIEIIKNNKRVDFYTHIGTTAGIREAREKTIKFVLEEMK